MLGHGGSLDFLDDRNENGHLCHAANGRGGEWEGEKETAARLGTTLRGLELTEADQPRTPELPPS
jgi:hypothetical protein